MRHPRTPWRPHRPRGRAWLVVAALLLAGCGDAEQAASGAGASPAESRPPAPTASPARASTTPAAPRTLDAADGFAVRPSGDRLVVRDAPDGTVVHELDAVRDSGAPLTLLLAQDPGDGWFEVLLPVRPNGSSGWVAAAEVTVQRVTHRLEMSVTTNELRLFTDGELVRTMPAASGTGDTPTPLGRFFLTELLEPTNAGYGPYAYGTSGFSEVLTSFGGGPGQVGLHGTDDADSVGRAVSHGCIRLSDEDITFLAETLPLGTPLDVLAA